LIHNPSFGADLFFDTFTAVFQPYGVTPFNNFQRSGQSAEHKEMKLAVIPEFLQKADFFRLFLGYCRGRKLFAVLPLSPLVHRKSNNNKRYDNNRISEILFRFALPDKFSEKLFKAIPHKPLKIRKKNGII